MVTPAMAIWRPARDRPVRRAVCRLAEVREVLERAYGRYWSLEHVARRTGFATKRLRSWERGESQPAVVEAVVLARDLGVTVEQLWLPFEPPSARPPSTDVLVRAEVGPV